jgi:uncharacterized protein YerC
MILYSSKNKKKSTSFIFSGFGASVERIRKISQSNQIYMDISTRIEINALIQKHRIIPLYMLNHNFYSIEIKS